MTSNLHRVLADSECPHLLITRQPFLRVSSTAAVSRELSLHYDPCTAIHLWYPLPLYHDRHVRFFFPNFYGSRFVPHLARPHGVLPTTRWGWLCRMRAKQKSKGRWICPTCKHQPFSPLGGTSLPGIPLPPPPQPQTIASPKREGGQHQLTPGKDLALTVAPGAHGKSSTSKGKQRQGPGAGASTAKTPASPAKGRASPPLGGRAKGKGKGRDRSGSVGSGASASPRSKSSPPSMVLPTPTGRKDALFFGSGKGHDEGMLSDESGGGGTGRCRSGSSGSHSYGFGGEGGGVSSDGGGIDGAGGRGRRQRTAKSFGDEFEEVGGLRLSCVGLPAVGFVTVNGGLETLKITPFSPVKELLRYVGLVCLTAASQACFLDQILCRRLSCLSCHLSCL